MKASKYAAAIRAGYSHPKQGRAIYRMSDDRSLKEKEQPAVGAGSEAERSFWNLWFALPDDVRSWCCGRLAATDSKAAAELLEDVHALDLWHTDFLGRRARFLAEGDNDEILAHGWDPMPGVRAREDGKVVDTENGELVDLEA